jgi:hypothetical protein
MVQKTGDKLLELLDPGNDIPPALEPVSDDDVPDLIPDPFDYGAFNLISKILCCQNLYFLHR